MRCTCVKQHLSTLADNEVTPLLNICLRRHLARCRRCAAEFLEIQRIGEQVREWRTAEAPDALRERVMGSLPHSVELTRNPFKSSRLNVHHIINRCRYAGVLGCILLLHWLIVARLDAQRADLLMLLPSDSTYVAAWQSDTDTVADAFALRSQMLASILGSDAVNPSVDLKGDKR